MRTIEQVFTKYSQIIVGQASEGNPFEGHTVDSQLDQVGRLTGKLPRIAIVDSEAISAKIFQSMIFELGTKIDFESVLEQITIYWIKKDPTGVASSGTIEKNTLNHTTTNLIDKFGNNIFSCFYIGS